MTHDEIEALCSLADQYALADDPPYATAFGDLAAALRALAQENETLRADKERLDWLERAVCSGVNLVAERDSVWLTRWRRRYISFHEWVGTGLRAALDAARAEETTT